MQRTPEEIELIRLRTRLTKRFHKACADYGLIANGDHILIGLSGGKDSLALVELLGKRAQIHVPRFQVTAVHVRVKERDYHSDLSYLEDFCARIRVPFIVRDTEIGDEAKGEKQAIHDMLVSLAQRHIITYIPHSIANTLTLTRERQAEIHLSTEIYDKHRQQYIEKLKAMVEYADNQLYCRSQLLLSYFGENTTATCGTCDVCRQKAKGER